ncbi:DUF7144 family membrane protein [Humibacter ginsenosidimutans]|uniref:DUF7144 domain-containing protein n=1 Tax=Humibacter ginsenosidimutans TaxID=2599293 RepID=A0A5B8LZS9_9MICO|nr:hypothetical protein [Humibacter ginsenosidimutans]QDZ13633.1 hypothetical protein FPZ11_01405 [Humibacter ginsenosidimutans]
MSAAVRRPAGVTLIAVLAWIEGALNIVAGIVLLVFKNEPSMHIAGVSESSLITSAILTILFGVVVVLVAGGLLRGSSGARIVVTVVQLLAIAGDAFTAWAYPDQFAWSAVSALISLLIIVLLWTGRANDFFRSR